MVGLWPEGEVSRISVPRFETFDEIAGTEKTAPVESCDLEEPLQQTLQGRLCWSPARCNVALQSDLESSFPHQFAGNPHWVLAVVDRAFIDDPGTVEFRDSRELLAAPEDVVVLQDPDAVGDGGRIGRRQNQLPARLEYPVQRLQKFQRVVEYVFENLPEENAVERSIRVLEKRLGIVEVGRGIGNAQFEEEFLATRIVIGVCRGDLESQKAEQSRGITVGASDLQKLGFLRLRRMSNGQLGHQFHARSVLGPVGFQKP